MIEKVYRTPDVFGIQRDVPLNYVTRPAVDEVFVESLTRDKHIVVYGSSKQGKTSLRKYNLKPEDYISVTCDNRVSLGQLHAQILKEAGYEIELSTTRTISGESKINARVGAGLNLGIVKVRTEVAGEEGTTEELEVQQTPLELDPSDVNDIIRALEAINFKGFIVLEDFHYLSQETQESFSVALKAFHEQSNLTFIIVGVWLDENRLITYNGDLTGRVLAVNADAWSQDELLRVITLGESMLNIAIDETFKSNLIDGCFDSVYIVQEACYRLCVDSGVSETQATCREIGSGVDARDLVRTVVNEQSARYDAFLSNFASGFQDTQLQMYQWLLLPILTATPKELERGLSYATLRKLIDANHPEAPVNPGNLTQALGSAASLQVRKKITPVVVDYDETNRLLNVVDRGFLTWLSYQDRRALREWLGLPDEPTIPAR